MGAEGTLGAVAQRGWQIFPTFPAVESQTEPPEMGSLKARQCVWVPHSAAKYGLLIDMQTAWRGLEQA